MEIVRQFTIANAAPFGEDGAYRFRLFGSDLNRNGVQIEPAGMDFSAYLQNPVFLENHDQSRIIGAMESIEQTLDGAFGTLKWDTSEEAQRIKGLYDRGMMRGVSVGYKPLAWQFIDNDNLFKIGGHSDLGRPFDTVRRTD